MLRGAFYAFLMQFVYLSKKTSSRGPQNFYHFFPSKDTYNRQWWPFVRLLCGSRYSSVLNMSHILFADDTLIFCGAISDHLHYPCALFLYCEVVSS
jgi:hypothetical protein